VNHDRIRFEELVAEWIDSHRSLNTQAAYRRDLVQFLSWWYPRRRRSPLSATPADVDRFESACVEAGESEATVARRLSALSSFFTFAVARGVVARSPVQGGRRPPTTATPTADLTAGQLAALLRSTARHGDRATLLVGLMLFDGLKLNEVLAADAEDVSLIPDGGAALALPRRGDNALRLDPRTSTACVSYLDGRTEGPLLLGESPTRAPARLTRFGADYLLKRISADAGFGRAISANTLRRGYVAGAFASGASVESIRDQLGHTDIRTTRRHLAVDV
jgi:site-specific recombinase XerD